MINKIFNVTGKTTILANVIYLPVINDNPQSSSMVFAKGIKYVEAIIPIWKALNSPLVAGSGAK